MKQKFINIYLLVGGAVAISTTLLQIQPAIFFIDFLAPNPGDKYSFLLVSLITFLIFLIPLLVFLVLTRSFRKTSTEIIRTERTGFFVKRQKSFRSALVGIPVYIDSKKSGTVDNGKTMFFDIPASTFTIQAGKGKQASEIIEVKILEKDQLKFEVYINKDGLFPKIELTLIKE
jgi:hypothetical protein